MAQTQATRGQYSEHFYPGTEELAADEMRITALGTGRPFLRRSQANASWLIELGNGDKFVFDFGFGSQMNFTALEIPYGAVNAWIATSPTRDFRQAKWSSRPALADGEAYIYEMDIPTDGYAALFGEAVYKSESLPYYLSTNVKIISADGVE